MATSFISERSAEYIIVPKLVRIMEQRFSKVIPLSFWTTREGSNIARACRPTQAVKIVRVFARRPKVTTPNQLSIEVKFNESIFETIELSVSLGIPTIAAVPLASSIIDLALDTDCAWFELVGMEKDLVYNISLEGKILRQSTDSLAVIEVRNEQELIDIAFNKCQPVEWMTVIENLKLFRSVSSRGSFWFGLGRYRPFYLLLFE